MSTSATSKSSTSTKTSSTPPSDVKDQIRGISYCVLWYFSILVGFYFLFAPTLFLLFVNRKLYRKICDTLFSTWEAFNVSLLEIIFGMKTFVSGDTIHADESSLIILNHRTRLDWNFLWAALFHATSPSALNAKLVLKNQIRKIPGIGWTMQMFRCMYINRCWKKDESIIEKMLSHYSEIQKERERPNNFQLILFPEGTNLTAETKRKSDIFATQNNLKHLNHLLHPRTTGFGYIANQMRDNGNLDAIYDVTIAYPDNLPEREEDLKKGKLPKEVHFYIKRYGPKSIPTTFIGLEKWLQELWREKDQLLENVYKEGIRFPANSSRQLQPQPILPLQYVTLFAWFLFIAIILNSLISLTWTSLYLWIWIGLVSTVMATVSENTDGLQELEILLERKEFWPKIWKLFVDKTLARFKGQAPEQKED